MHGGMVGVWVYDTRVIGVICGMRVSSSLWEIWFVRYSAFTFNILYQDVYLLGIYYGFQNYRLQNCLFCWVLHWHDMMDVMAIEYKQNAVDTVLYRGRSSSYKHPVAQYAPVCARCCMDRKLHPQTKPPFL